MPSSARGSSRKQTPFASQDLSKTFCGDYSTSWSLSGSQMRLSNRSNPENFNAFSSSKMLAFRDSVSPAGDASGAGRATLSDRPWTANTLSNRSSAVSQRLPVRKKSLQQRSLASATTTTTAATTTAKQRHLNWSSRASSCQSLAWCSSVDSELATVGSDVFDSSESSTARNSFAIFGSSADDSEAEKPAGFPTNKMADPAVKTSQPSVHFELPLNDEAETDTAAQEDCQGTSREQTNDCEDSVHNSSASFVLPDTPPAERHGVTTEMIEKSTDNEETQGNDSERNSSVSSRMKLQSSKLLEIISFLDDAECNSRHNTCSSSSRMDEPVKPEESDGLNRTFNTQIDHLHGMTNKQLIEEVLSLKVLLDDKDIKLATVERALHHQRELLTRNAKSAQRELAMRLRAQKEEYEATLERHVGFIQQLVDEKKKLAEKCQNLATELRQLVARHEDERRVTDERHAAELRRLKQSIASSSRQKQDKWVMEKTERIRELTARGLEPELRRLMGQHQQELQSLRTLHQGELLRTEQNLMQKTAHQLAALREHLDAERDAACARERESARAKFEKQLEEMETLHTEKYRRLQADLENEKQHLVDDGERLRRQHEETTRKMEDNFRREKQATIQILQAEIETLREKHQENVGNLRRQWDAEKADEIASVRHVLELKLSERERVWAETRAREREDEIQKFTRQIADEIKKRQEEWEAITESRIARLREKHCAEVADLERSESDLREKYSETRRNLSCRDEELATLRVSLVQRLKELEEANRTLEQLSSERQKVREVVQKEVRVELERLEEERRLLRTELSRLRTEHSMEMSSKDAEIQQLIAAHEKSLADIHDKVKQTVSKKDETLQQTQQKLQAALLRCQHLEELLDRQQREFTFKKK